MISKEGKNLREVLILTLRTEQSIPALLADALERLGTVSILASRQRYAFITLFTIESNLTATLIRSLAVPVHRVTASSTDGHVTKVSLPSWQTLYLSIVIAFVVRGSV